MGISGMSYPSGAGDTVHSLVQIILLTQQIIDFFKSCIYAQYNLAQTTHTPFCISVGLVLRI